MNPRANGLYSRISARILLTHRPFPLSSSSHILSALCVCVSMSLSLHAHQLTAQRKMAQPLLSMGFNILIFNKENNMTTWTLCKKSL